MKLHKLLKAEVSGELTMLQSGDTPFTMWAATCALSESSCCHGIKSSKSHKTFVKFLFHSLNRMLTSTSDW